MRTYFLFLFLFPCLFLSAQDTGSVNWVIDFDEPDYDETRNLYLYVPSDYDAETAYPLIVGFRGGPHSNAGQFRDQLTPLSDSLGAIILCPENSAEFVGGTEEKVKQLYQYSLAELMSVYNIDEDRIYITGLSYGGRHTIIVSLDEDAGPIPANIRGIIPFAPGTNSENVPEYENSTLFPVCTCIGLLDSNFEDIANDFHDNILANDGEALLNEIPGIGHTTNFPTFPEEMMECFNFIEDQYETPVSVSNAETNAYRLYPNPSTGTLYVETGESEVGAIHVQVFDNLGRPVFETISSEKEFQLPVGLKGMFSVCLLNQGEIIMTQKVFVK